MADTPETPKTAPTATMNDEIDSIMSEIEQLQKEMSAPMPTPVAAAPVAAAAVATPVQAAPTVASSVDDLFSELQAAASTEQGGGLEETLGEIKAAAPESGVFSEADTKGEETMSKATAGQSWAQDSSNAGGSDGTLSLTLSGNMTLKLKYEFEGQEVTISFADQALRVQMTDGTEFKLPVARIAQTGTVKAFKKAV
jgi:hypothetical protein